VSRVFSGEKFVARLRRAFAGANSTSVGHSTICRFAAFLSTLFRQHWVVYAKPAFGGSAHVLRYLGCYTHRVAISDHRRELTESAEVFIRSLLLQLSPSGFARILRGTIPGKHCEHDVPDLRSAR
jgi:hypothetical protein